MIRATTGGVLRTYRANLMNSMIRDNKARETVLTQRVFNSYAEDPAAAAKAFRLRKSRLMANSQLKICDDTYHKFQVAFASLQSVSQLIDTTNGAGTVSTLKSTTLKMLNDPEGSARTQLKEVLDNLDDTIIQMLNQTYGDEFIFAGADGYNVPFTIEEVDGVKQLYYRGVPVDAHQPPEVRTDGDEFLKVTADGKYDPTLADEDTNYIKKGNTTLMLAADYDAEYQAPPALGPDGTDKKYKFNEETGLYEEDNENGDSYMLADGSYMSITDFEMADIKFQNRPKLLEEADPANPGGYVPVKVDENGNPADDGAYYLLFKGEPEEAVISKSQYDKDKADAEKLEYLVNEKHFVDIGLGFKEDANGKLIESSAFNEALCGLTFLGHGVDEEGDPKNIYSIVQRLKDIAGSVPDGQEWDKATYDEFYRLVGKLEDASAEFKTQFTNQSAGTEKLKNNYNLLEENVYNLKVQYSNLEDVNMADAISSFIWAEYCYNAALKVGNSILSQSLMDYLS